MTRPPRPTPPSAIDGFRRLDRTRTVQGVATPIEGVTAVVDAQPIVRRTPRRVLGRRVASSLRLLAFIAVLATIVGTSVSLAGSNGSSRTPAKRDAPTVAVTTGTALAKDTAPVDESGTEMIPTPKTTSVTVNAASTTAATAPSGALPLTGVLDINVLLLAGSMLVLLGMLAQIAGTPLPAARAAR